MIKVRPELSAVALRVWAEFRQDTAQEKVIAREDVDRAIAAQAKAPVGSRPFSDEESTLLVALRSWAFKSPDKKLLIG